MFDRYFEIPDFNHTNAASPFKFQSKFFLIMIYSIKKLIFLSTAFAIRCWTCNSQTSTESFCDDPFDSSVIYRQNRRWSYIDCVLPPISQYNPYGQGSFNGNGNGGNGGYNSYNSYDGSTRLRPVCQKSKDRSKFSWSRNLHFSFELIFIHSIAVDGRVFVHRKCAWVRAIFIKFFNHSANFVL